MLPDQGGVLDRASCVSGQKDPLTGNFDFNDFHRRWGLARASVWRTIVGTALEPRLPLVVEASKRTQLLKSIFEVSLKLGMSAVRYRDAPFDARSLAALLQGSDVPCLASREGSLASTASDRGNAALLRMSCKNGCGQSMEVSPFACDYWREAIDGLVLGLSGEGSESLRYARYRSVGHGDSECVDMIYPSALFHLRWGPIPGKTQRGLGKVENRFRQKGIDVRFLGLSEGVVYYAMSSTEFALCGPGGRLIGEGLERELRVSFPELAFQDASPRAVMGAIE